MVKKGPLSGIRVVEVATALAAPAAARIMADQGADVIKVEAPGLGQHADQVLREIGLASEVESLRAENTVS